VRQEPPLLQPNAAAVQLWVRPGLWPDLRPNLWLDLRPDLRPDLCVARYAAVTSNAV